MALPAHAAGAGVLPDGIGDCLTGRLRRFSCKSRQTHTLIYIARRFSHVKKTAGVPKSNAHCRASPANKPFCVFSAEISIRNIAATYYHFPATFARKASSAAADRLKGKRSPACQAEWRSADKRGIAHFVTAGDSGTRVSASSRNSFSVAVASPTPVKLSSALPAVLTSVEALASIRPLAES